MSATRIPGRMPELVEQRRGVDAFHRRYRATHAAGLRAPLGHVRLRAGASADAAPVRPGDRPAARGRRRTRSGARAGARRRAAVVPHAGVHRDRQAASRADPFGFPGGRDRRGRRRPAVRRDARGRRRPSPADRIRAIEAILRGDVEHAFHPGGGLHHAMPRSGVGLLHLRRSGARDRPRAARRPARAVRRPRRPPRRRRPGDPLGRPGRHDPVRSTRPGATCSRGPAGWGSWARARRRGRRSTCRSSPGRGGGLAGGGAARCSPSWPPRSGRTSSCRSTAPTRTPGIRSPTCA